MKKKNNRWRRNVLVSGGFFLALLLSDLPQMHAEDRKADNPLVEPKVGKAIKENEQPMEPAISRDSIHMVGPSGEEIHDFLYPTPNDGKVVTPAN